MLLENSSNVSEPLAEMLTLTQNRFETKNVTLSYILNETYV